jgi:hypothetical protein
MALSRTPLNVHSSGSVAELSCFHHGRSHSGLLYVDASRKANMGSSCSHSCDSNCTSAVVARNGKLVICLTTVSSGIAMLEYSHPGIPAASLLTLV